MSVIVTVHSYQFLPLLYKSEHLLTNAGIKPFFSHASRTTLGKAIKSVGCSVEIVQQLLNRLTLGLSRYEFFTAQVSLPREFSVTLSGCL